MTRQQRTDCAKRVQLQHQELRNRPRCSQEQLVNRRAAILFAAIAVGCFAGSLWLNQPVMALAAVVFLAAAVLVARHG